MTFWIIVIRIQAFPTCLQVRLSVRTFYHVLAYVRQWWK